jgi:hypothetical protein
MLKGLKAILAKTIVCQICIKFFKLFSSSIPNS